MLIGWCDEDGKVGLFECLTLKRHYAKRFMLLDNNILAVKALGAQHFSYRLNVGYTVHGSDFCLLLCYM